MKFIIREYEDDPLMTPSTEIGSGNGTDVTAGGDVITVGSDDGGIGVGVGVGSGNMNNEQQSTTTTTATMTTSPLLATGWKMEYNILIDEDMSYVGANEDHVDVNIDSTKVGLLQQRKNPRTTVSIRRPAQHQLHRQHYGMGGFYHGTVRVMVQLFLPLGYPHSVDASYLPYQLYDGLQGLCSYWRGVVSTRAVLEATGVGNSQITAMSAALTWALRDGTGMVGGLLFSYTASQYFDTHVKEFRLFADIANDFALTLDMFAPYVGTAGTIWILSLSTICRTMCGMSAGATKGRITQHFARENGNMADLTAKESTQETLVSLLGMIGGVIVAKMLEHSPSLITWLMFGFLTIVHVWANYKAVMLLKLATLNPERTRELFHKLVGKICVCIDDDDDNNLNTNFEHYDYHHHDTIQGMESSSTNYLQIEKSLLMLSTPEEIHESLWKSTNNLFFPTIHVSSSTIDPSCLYYLSEFTSVKYVIGIKDRNNNNNNNNTKDNNHLYIWLSVGAQGIDELQAYLHAMVLQEAVQRGSQWNAKLIQRYVIVCCCRCRFFFKINSSLFVHALGKLTISFSFLSSSYFLKNI